MDPNRCEGCQAVFEAPLSACPNCGRRFSCDPPSDRDELAHALGIFDGHRKPKRWPALLSALLFPAWMASLAAALYLGNTAGYLGNTAGYLGNTAGM
jgi:hypothetical protein